MKRFTPELVETEHKLAQRFVVGLEKKMRHTVEIIAHTTYVATLRATKTMEGNICGEPREPPSINCHCGTKATL